MAKMQGFGGKADATLVAAATRAAYGGVPKDLSGIFNNIAGSYARGMSQLGAGIAQAAQAAGSAYATAKTEAKKQDELVQAGGKYFEGQGETLQKQLEDIKTERSEIRGETGFLSKERREQMRANRRKEDKIYASLAQIDNTMQEAKNSFIEGGLDHVMMGEDSNNFFSTFFAGGGEVKNAKGDVIGKTKIDFDEDGNEVISFLDADGNVKNNKYGKPMQGDIEFVKGLMVMKDPKTKEQTAKITQLLYNTGKGGGAWDENTQNQLRNNLGDLINERTVGSMLREKFGTQKQSFYDALTSADTKESAQMFNLLNNQFQFTDKSLDVTGGPKGEPDGKIDEKDFEADASKFINVLTDKAHPNYDPSATKQAYVDFLVDGEAKTQWQMGRNIYNKKLATEKEESTVNQFGYEAGKTQFSVNAGGVQDYVTGQDIENAVLRFKKIQDEGKGGFTAYNGKTYQMASDGKWSVSYIDDDGKTISQPGLSSTTIMNDLGLGTNQKILDFVKVKNKTGNDLPEMPSEKDNQIKLIMSSNANLSRKQAEDLYEMQQELNK